MNKPPFSRAKAIKTVTISNQIEGYEPVKDKKVLQRVKAYISKDK
jgi:hypothetical protein